MFKVNLLLFSLLNILFLCYANHRNHHDHGHRDRLIVNTSLGTIRGSIITSRLGKNIYSFRSIRYAKAPVGELRFQPPVPVEKWNDTYDATEAGPVCPQPNNQNSSEDCLVLNVYTNKLPWKNCHTNRPVLIYFHPGGFYGFNGASYMFGPEYLLDKRIILVTANYRLGSLGFLSTGTKEAPGNNGFKDQVLVLKWVRDNIEAFGGDPNTVTLGGYSAGAWSTTLHIVSPMSKGLFHKTIIQSSSALGHATIATNQIELAKKQARLVNCTDDTPTDIINCLKTKSAQEIADTLPGFAEVGGDPILIWTAVIEPDFGQERFLIEHPVTSILNGQNADVPTIIGITEYEFGYVSYIAMLFQKFLDLISDDYLRVLPIIFNYERNTTRSNDISRSLYKFYFGDGRLVNNSDTRIGIAHLYEDGVVGFPTNRAVKLIAQKNSANTYYYCFTYRGRYSYFYLPNSNNVTVGAVHHDDMQYLFHMANLFPRINESDPEWDTVTKMVKMWTDFVKTGNPTPKKSELLNDVEWIPFKAPDHRYLEIGDRMLMKQNLYEKRYKEWETLFPLSNYS